MENTPQCRALGAQGPVLLGLIIVQSCPFIIFVGALPFVLLPTTSV